MDWARILAYVGTVDQELLASNNYLATAARLAEVATVARPDAILAWYHKLVARKFDGRRRVEAGRPLASSDRFMEG